MPPLFLSLPVRLCLGPEQPQLYFQLKSEKEPLYTTLLPAPHFSARKTSISSLLYLRSPRGPRRYAFSTPCSSHRRTVLMCTLRSLANCLVVSMPFESLLLLFRTMSIKLPKTALSYPALTLTHLNSTYDHPKVLNRVGY
jgi:hypothetical protein